MIRKLLRTVVRSLCLVGLLWASNADAEEGRFLVITDLHFNPFHGLDADEFARLSKTPVDRWRSFFAGLDQPVVRLGSDSNYTLLDSALTASSRQAEHPEFILFGGDFMAHDWQSRYSALAPEPIAAHPQAFQDFTVASIRFIAEEFRERFPDAVILPTLGNEDAFCQDYWIQANGAFLKRFAEVWKPLLGTTVDPVAFDRSFPSLGCYVAAIPGLKNPRLIVLNSLFWSKSFCCSYHAPGSHNCCGCADQGAAPGTAALAWLEEALSQSRKEKEDRLAADARSARHRQL